MARFFLTRDAMGDSETQLRITGADAHHIAYSLRMAVGETLTVCDDRRREYLCRIASVQPTEILLDILETKQNDTELPVSVHLYQSLAKGEKMEYIIQKAVELGVSSVTPVSGARCIVRMDAKKAAERVVRWQRIAEEAAKQCGRGLIPEIRPVTSFSEAVKEGAKTDVPLFCYEGDGTTSLKTVFEEIRQKNSRSFAVFVGPEGGYAPEEVAQAQAARMYAVNLGKRILRCETASGFVLSCFTYAFEL